MTEKRRFHSDVRIWYCVAVLAVFCALGAGGGMVSAQTPEPAATASPTPTPMPPSEFTGAMWLANQQEVIDATYVAQRTHDVTIRRFAQGMIDDHSGSNVDLRSVGRSAGVPVPATQPSPTAVLVSLVGAQLDNEYMAHEIANLGVQLTLVRDEALHGDPPQLRTYADIQSSMVSRHLDSAILFVIARRNGALTMPNPSSRSNY